MKILPDNISVLKPSLDLLVQSGLSCTERANSVSTRKNSAWTQAKPGNGCLHLMPLHQVQHAPCSTSVLKLRSATVSSCSWLHGQAQRLLDAGAFLPPDTEALGGALER